MKNLHLYLILGIGILVVGYLLFSACGPNQKKMDELATCLGSKGVKMYGAFWCPHCNEQKKMFGSSFSKIQYIECSTPDGKGQLQVCKDAGIDGYPTWEFPNGIRASGELKPQDLAEKAGCQYSEN
jgi:hypothetical protein